jgi:basic membrane protein A
VSASAAKKSVTFIADVGGLDDHGYNQYSYLGMVAGAKKTGLALHTIQTTDASQYETNITTAAQQSGLVVMAGFDFGDALQTVSKRFPKTDFAIEDYEYTPPLKNVQADVFEANQSSYLGGIVAAGISKSHSIGFVGGVDESVLQQFLAGFEAGALAENPKTHIKVEWTGSFSNEQAGKQAAQAEIAQGADVIYTAAGGSGIGGLAAANSAHVWAIGVDSDQNYLFPHTVVTSVIKELNVVAADNVESYAKGAWKPGTQLFDLANHGVGLAPFHGLADVVPAAVKAQIAAATKAIASGKIVVPSKPKYPNGH